MVSVDINQGWTLSRERMPDYDGEYIVAGWINTECGNSYRFQRVMTCRMNQWVKTDVGEQCIENRNLDRKLAQARVSIAPVIDSLPQVKRYADLVDSTIAARDSTINAFGMRMRAMEVSHRDEVRELGKKHVAAVGLSQEYAGRVSELEKKLKREQKIVSLGITTGPGMFVTPDGQMHVGLGANVGLTFKIRLRKR